MARKALERFLGAHKKLFGTAITLAAGYWTPASSNWSARDTARLVLEVRHGALEIPERGGRGNKLNDRTNGR